MRRWSVLRWPVALAAMSDRTPSAGPPSHSRKIARARRDRGSPSPEFDALDRVHLEKVDGDHPAPAARAPSSGGRDLAPAAGRGAEIDDALPGLEQLVLVGDLQKLKGRARAKTLAPGLRDVGVVELALEPQRRGERALAGRLHPGLQRPAALAARAGAAHRQRALRCGPTPSSRISWLRMPSRRPRSAMRSRSAGKCDADRFENRAAREHEVRALVSDAGVGGALGVAHRAEPRDRVVDLGCGRARARRPRAGRSAAD